MPIKIYSQELLAQHRDMIPMPPGFDIRSHVREIAPENGGRVYEFIGNDDFGSEWVSRTLYEVDSGRLEVPLLIEPLLTARRDPNFPKNVTVATLGPAGVVLEEIKEGGEVKFGRVSSGSRSVAMKHYATGLEYDKDFVMYNETWNVGIYERAVGQAYNALLNNLVFSAILTYSYAAANQTAASSTGSTLEEKTFRTVEDGITASKADTTNPRPGPYLILANSSNLFTLERALYSVPQQGFTKQSSAINMIRGIIAYDGWTGTRGKKTTTYTGVTANKCYLIDMSHRDLDFQLYIKQDLQSEMGNPDLSRFIKEQRVWDTYMGYYCNPVGAVEEITLPTS